MAFGKLQAVNHLATRTLSGTVSSTFRLRTLAAYCMPVLYLPVFSVGKCEDVRMRMSRHVPHQAGCASRVSIGSPARTIP